MFNKIDESFSISGLFLRRRSSETTKDGQVLLGDAYACFCGSSANFDLLEDERVTMSEKELKGLSSDLVFAIESTDGLLYFSMSNELRLAVSQEPGAKLQEAERYLVQLVVFRLADPYTEPLWQSVSLCYLDILKSVVIPFLSHVGTEDLRSLILPWYE